jgi:hypothetical protein
MAKRKLFIGNYTFDVINGTVILPDNIAPERLLLITDVTINKQIYNFSDPNFGYNSVSYNAEQEETTISLKANLSALGASNTDRLQIFIDNDVQEVEFSESFIDPVNKIRVSNPENLIDTDFEYGLQSTKWETLELSNNIPSFYSSGDGYGLFGIIKIQTIASSNIITVTLTQPHGLAKGSPIDVKGLDSNTAEGKYLVDTIVSDIEFTYKARKIQSSSAIINGPYTTIVPGQFYSGSSIEYTTENGIISDLANQSKITVTTSSEHGFNANTNFYLLNSVSPKSILLSNVTTDNAPDGRPYVDNVNTLNLTQNPNTNFTETKHTRGAYSKKIIATDVNTTSNRILWNTHGFLENDCVFYVKPTGDTSIGGLTSLNVYYITNPTTNDFQLKATFNGPPITLTSTGTYVYGRGEFMIAYEIENSLAQYTTWRSYFYTYGHNSGIGSGWDLRTDGYGKMGAKPTFLATFFKGTNLAFYGSAYSNVIYNQPFYSPYYTSGMTIPDNGTTPNSFNFVEDITRYVGAETFNTINTTFFTNSFYRYTAYYYSGATYTFARGEMFMIPLNYDTEADSFYVQNHGLTDGQTITFSTLTGSAPTYILPVNGNYTTVYTPTNIANGNYTVEVVSNDRFRLKSGTTVLRLHSANGTYSFAATVLNSVRNSFYIANHGLTTNNTIQTNVENSGVLPTTQTGPVTYLASNTDLKVMYNIVGNAIQEFINEQEVLSGQTYKDLVFDGSNSSIPFIYGSGSSTNTTFQGSVSWIANLYHPSYGTFYPNYATGRFDTGDVEDFGKETSLVGLGFKIITVPYEKDKLIPYYLNMTTGPYRQSHGIQNALRHVTSESQTTYDKFVNTTNPTVYTTSGSVTTDWRYARTAQYINASGRDVIVKIDYAFSRDAWRNGQSFLQNVTATNTSNIYSHLYNSATFDTAKAFVMIRVPDAVTLNNAWFDALDVKVMNSLVQNFQYPALTLGNNYLVDVVNNNRFRLKSQSGLELDLTTSGTQNLKFVDVTTPYGTIDGVYSVTSVPEENKLEFSLPFKADKKETFIQVSSQTYNDYFYVSTGHTHANKTPVIYRNNGNTNLTGLINGNTYYIYVTDDLYFKLAENINNLNNNIFIGITWSGQPTGTTHIFESNTVNGFVSLSDTISVTSGSRTVTGSSSSKFKTFYKSGDTIYIKNKTSTPGKIEEFTVSGVIDDIELSLAQESTFTSSDTKHMVKTKLYTRPDGATLHRPFDGGVEINAGTSPGSQIVRQTRKYFRYQSGKGIQVSLAINFNPSIQAEDIYSSGINVYIKTKYPHGLTTENTINVKESLDTEYNGSYKVETIIDDFNFTYKLPSVPSTTVPSGIISYNIDSWQNSSVRGGLFDFQNGFFYEFDGQTLYAVRRSSTQQISGTVTATFGSNEISGNGTNFSGQLVAGDNVVIRGMTYKITKIKSKQSMAIQPSYKGLSNSGIIVTKTIDTKVPQHQWNIDKCDGTGQSGFVIDKTKIQMGYMDYSWYGAGKIRFGFKDRNGHVKYVHEFIHNNRLTEAYMRSGNIPARYEIENTGQATYIPSLFHWGTSVIMDGTFNDDKAYLFTAASDNLTFTNGQSLTANTNANSTLVTIYNRDLRTYDWYVQLSFASTDASKFSVGTLLYTANGQLNGNKVTGASYSGSNYLVRIFIASQQNVPSSYPIVASATAVGVGAPISGGVSSEILNKTIPLLSIRLAPSVDNGITGNLGEREIINRMQLQLKGVGLVLTHDAEVALIINGSLSNSSFEKVQSPSLSNLIKHVTDDSIIGGTEIFSFRASGGNTDSTGKRLSNTSNFDLTEITDLGNSILGGNGVFPNGPDLLTIAIRVNDTSTINAVSPFIVSSRITWSESQA